MSFTASDVENALLDDELTEYGSLSWSEYAWGEHDFNEIKINGVSYEFEVVDSKDGSEGDWETNTFVVFRVGDRYFRKTGYYQSHNGTYWDGDFTEVTEGTKTVKVWKSV